MSLAKKIAPKIMTLKDLNKAERSELIHYQERTHVVSNEWIKRQVVYNNRIDILATEILGYEIHPHHMALLQFQFAHPDNLQLVFRGAGKSTTCTIAKAIHLLLKNPNLRIVIASKTSGNAKGFLKEIKGHFEENERLAEIFGEYYDPRKVNKWDDTEIEVLPRTSTAKEASITCVGVEGTIVSKHYDIIIADDLVDEDNSRTEHMREKTRQWYYQTLDPTLEPPDADVPHRGEYHRLGTRYHYADLYGHLIKNELAKHHQIIPALKDGKSPWPQKYPATWFAQKRKKSGLIIFNAQYQCDTEAMKGEIFRYEDCQVIESAQIPSNLTIFMGIDLAISEKDTADHFAIVVIGIDDNGNIYVVDFWDGQLRFADQTKKIKKYYKKWDPTRAFIEANAYQHAQYQELKDSDVHMRVKPYTQIKDKMARAWKLSSVFEDGKVFFKKTGKTHRIIEQLVLFPNEKKDLFDALDLAYKASKRKKRRRRESEPGLM